MADPKNAAPSPAQIAERLQRRRVRVMWAQAVVFMIMQASYYSSMPSFDAPLRTVDQVKLSAFAVWAVALMVLLGVSGGLFRSKAVRALMDDELTRSHRRAALAAGYYAAMLTALIFYVVSQYIRMSPPEAIHAIVTVGVIVPMVRFIMLERRADREG